VKPYQCIITAETSHLHVDEAGAPEKHLGVKVIPLASPNGKITPEQILRVVPDGDFHHAQPRVVSITQCTEYGTVYSLQELRDITEIAHKHNMLVHMDGARYTASLRDFLLSLASDLVHFQNK